MKYKVIGRKVSQYKDKDASLDAGHNIFKIRVDLYCIHNPSRLDSNSVEGQQCICFTFFEGNGLLDDVKLLDIGSEFNGTVESRSYNGRTYVNLVDFDLI